VKSFIATVTVCLLLVFAVSASAQTRTRRTAPAQKRRTASSTNLERTRFNAQRLELAGLSKDMTRFLYLYGRLSKDLELTGTQSESSDVTNKTKAGLLDNVRAMSNRLEQLEGHFRFAAGLESPYKALEGVARRADEAAQNVSSNRFDQAGRVLLDIATQLTDALLDMP
jgi:hypothetical protein